MNTEPTHEDTVTSAPESFIDIRISVDTHSADYPTLGIGEVSDTSLPPEVLTQLMDELDPNAAFSAIFGGINAFLDIPADVQTSEDIASDI